MKKTYIKPASTNVSAVLGIAILETIGGQSHNPVGEGGDVEFSGKQNPFFEDDEDEGTDWPKSTNVWE